MMSIYFQQMMEFKKPGLKKEIYFYDLKVEDKLL